MSKRPPRRKRAATPTTGSQTRALEAAANVVATASAKKSAAKSLAATTAAAAIGTSGTGARAAHVVNKQVSLAALRIDDARAEQDRIDAAHMRRALELAEQYRGRTSPNPIVGCVIVDVHGDVVAEGVHRGPGTKHAEIDALDHIGRASPGGTLYCTLEPCTHQGRTPPCAPVVAGSGLARVVIGSTDPIPAHGGGIAVLERAGLSVSRALVEECDLANLPFRTWALTRRAAFTLKAAITLDGKIATVGGESKWITSEAAREHAHRLRSTHDAILVGVGTVLADDPQLTSRIADGRDPVRVVVDSDLRTPPAAKLLPRKKGARTIIATTERASRTRAAALQKQGAEIWHLPEHKGHVSLAALAGKLAEESLQSVLVEGGGEVHAALLAADLATDLQLFVAPVIVGGPAPSWVGGTGVPKLSQAHRFRFVGEPRQVGGDLLVRAVRW